MSKNIIFLIEISFPIAFVLSAMFAFSNKIGFLFKIASYAIFLILIAAYYTLGNIYCSILILFEVFIGVGFWQETAKFEKNEDASIANTLKSIWNTFFEYK